MRRLLLAGLFAGWALASGRLPAQTNAATNAQAKAPANAAKVVVKDGKTHVVQGSEIPTKSQTERLNRARDKALADNPRLKSETDALVREAKSIPNSTPEQQRAFSEKVKANLKKLHQAMVKEDPELAPLLNGMENQLQAYKPAPPDQESTDRQNKVIGFLSPADQRRVINAHAKALADHPDLQAEEALLLQQSHNLQHATPEQRQIFSEKVLSNQEKLRQAMLKEDPALRPLLRKIDKHMSQMRAQSEKEANSRPGASGP